MIIDNLHCNFSFFGEYFSECLDDSQNPIKCSEAIYIKNRLSGLSDEGVYLDCYPLYKTSTADISVLNGFTNGEIVLSVFGFLIFITLLFSFFWNLIHHKKIRLK